MSRHPIRVLWRFFLFLGVCGCALLDFVLRVWLTGRAGEIRKRTEWSRRWGRAFASVLQVEIMVEGRAPSAGILVSNHLSYLDIVVFATTRPMVFVSKADVQRWPMIGWLTRCAGSLFLKREVKADVVRIGQQFAPLIAAGEVIAVFPEGTSSGGDAVLPFKASLFAPVAAHGWTLTPAAIRYQLDDGDVSQEVAYWADMSFAPHFMNLLSKRRIRATVRFGEPIEGVTDRKQLAREAHDQVTALHAELTGSGADPIRVQ
jgi:1-acyl-sn-glycerol-3-phosphate acyltransferase